MWDSGIILYRVLRYLSMKLEKSIGEKSFVEKTVPITNAIDAVVGNSRAGWWRNNRGKNISRGHYNDDYWNY